MRIEATTDRRGRIIEAAVELFNSKGCRAVTMEQIAGSIRISKRTLYEVFATKDELVLSCLTRVEGSLGQMPMENDGEEPFATILHIMRSAMETNVRYARLLEDSERYYPELNAQLMRSVGMRFRESLKPLMERADEKGDLREGADIDLATEIITQCIMRGFHNVGRSEGKEKVGKLLSETCFTFLRGLLSNKAIERYDRV